MISCPLPAEILLQIFGYIEDDFDLFRLASSTRLFNQLALETFFLRHKTGIRFPFKSLSTVFPGLPLTCLKGLLLSLDLPRIQFKLLHYYYNPHFNQQTLIQEVEMLTRLVDAVGQIDHLKLLLSTFPFNSDALHRANDKFLETVCRNSSIRTLEVSGSSETFDESLGKTRRSNDHTNAKQFIATVPGSLEDLTLRFLPSYFRRFYSDILIINRTSLTRLHISNMPPNKKKALIALLTAIHLPSLHDLSFSNCNHHLQTPVLNFINKHPALICVTYQLDTNLYPGGRSRFPSLFRMAAPHHMSYSFVEELKVNMPYVHCFVSLKSPMPALQRITLYCTYDAYMMGRKIFDEALSALRHCPAGLHLTLNSVAHEFDLGEWLNNLPVDDLYRPERTLTCIRSVSLEQSAKPFDASLLDCLPEWFALFPALEDIEIWTMPAQIPFPSSKPDTIWPSSQPQKIAEEVKQVCGMVRRLSMVSGMERAQHLWDDGLSKYQYSSSTRNIWRKKAY